jgi:hypothetical protein
MAATREERAAKAIKRNVTDGMMDRNLVETLYTSAKNSHVGMHYRRKGELVRHLLARRLRHEF